MQTSLHNNYMQFAEYTECTLAAQLGQLRGTKYKGLFMSLLVIKASLCIFGGGEKHWNVSGLHFF